MALKDTDMIRKIHRLRDEIKNTSVAIGRRAFLELPPDPELLVVLRGSTEALIAAAEEVADVRE